MCREYAFFLENVDFVCRLDQHDVGAIIFGAPVSREAVATISRLVPDRLGASATVLLAGLLVPSDWNDYPVQYARLHRDVCRVPDDRGECVFEGAGPSIVTHREHSKCGR